MSKFSVLMVGPIFLGSALLAIPVLAAEISGDVAALYLKNCSICHGDKGDAQTRARSGMSPKPRDFTTAEAAMELSRERMIKSVTDGRPGTAMVGHKGRLSEVKIAALVDYIRVNFMQVPLAGQDAAQSGVTEAVSLGEKVYSKNCSVCHGDNGNTAYWAKNGLNPPPRDFTSPEAQSDLTRQRMIHSVTNGRPGTGMMPFNTRLSAKEIASVVGYIRFKFMGMNPDKDTGGTPMAQVVGATTIAQVSKAKPSAAKPFAPATASDPHAGGTPVADATPSALGLGMPGAESSSKSGGHVINVDMSEALPNKLKADVKWGREFYMKNCFTCHGVKGEGNGPRAYFNRPRPRDFTSDASRQILNRPRVFDSITKGRVGTVMPAWGKVLTEQEIANLTEFVFQAFIQGKGAQDMGAAMPDKTSKLDTNKETIKETGKKKAS